MVPALTAACARWRLTLDGPPIETPTSTVHRVTGPDGSPAILKCLTPAGREERAAIPLLRWYDGGASVGGASVGGASVGGASVRLLDAHGDTMLLEYLDGPPLSSLVDAGRDTEATKILATVCRALHAPRSPTPAGLHDLAARFQPLRDAAGTDALHTRAAAAAAHLLTTGPTAIPLHGDLHHGNILADTSGAWRAIDPQGLIGDPHYDLANALCNPLEFPGTRDPNRATAMAHGLAAVTGLDAARLLAYAACHACLAALWCLQDGTDPHHAQVMADTLDALVNP